MDPDSRSASVTPADVADSLQVLRGIVGRELPADQWDEVDQSVTLLTTALTAGDGDTVRHATGLLELLSPERGPTTLARVMPAPSGVRARVRRAVEILERVVPVAIYLSDGGDHELVESAVRQYLDSLGFSVIGREDPVTGSWWLRMLAALGIHAVEARLVQAQDAQNTALLTQSLAPVIASLQSTKDAVIRLGAVLEVKVDWTIIVTQLTAEQQLVLDHSPQLMTTPQKILHGLVLPPT